MMLKKVIYAIFLISISTLSIKIEAGRGSGSGFALGFFGGALMNSALNGNMSYGYGYYPPTPYPYAYAPQYNYYVNSGYMPY